MDRIEKNKLRPLILTGAGAGGVTGFVIAGLYGTLLRLFFFFFFVNGTKIFEPCQKTRA